jgi:tetratricopeptide (TPR) repeat protein
VNDSTKTLLRIEAIFNEAVAAPDDARPALIASLCNGDAALMAETQSLLNACAAEEHITASRRHEFGDFSLESAPKLVGHYQIDRLLGRGGMGAVYLGHRADGQFEQQVAIKLIDLPLATDLFRERFRQERQILAGLQHPFIARLLDGGVTGQGDLYLVMEYVDGIPIHRFCEAKYLTVRQRLALFRSVCDAVQFAHQNLVVHRDLKPDNIIVAEDGTPRLLDFGTAKLLSPSRSGLENQFTRQGYQSFTPQYASPEQVLGNSVTTASDTYSLGVLLYRLLTGVLPYELKEFTTEEMVRVICHEPPRTPSLAAGPNRRLDADLQAILLKALRKEPAKRYVTVEQFANDVQAYLDGQPVTARRGTLRYRAGKFVRRHRLALAAAGLLALTLLVGLAGVLWEARVANAERRKAEARSADLRQLSSSLLSELDEAIKQLPGSTGAQNLLVTRVLEHLDRMAKDSQGDRVTQLDLIDSYVRLGNVQGNVYEQNLGDRAGGLATIDKAIVLAQALVTSSPSDPDALRALAVAQGSKGEMLSSTSDVQGAVANLQTAAQTYDRLLSLPALTPALLVEASTINSTLGDVLGQDTGLADIDAALASYRKSLDLDTRALAMDPGFLRARRGLANMQMHIGNAELDIDPARALKDFELALQRLDALPASEQGSISTVRLRGITIRKIATALSELGEYSQAIPLFEQAIQTHQRFVDADPKDTRSLRDLKRTLEDEASSYEYAASPVLAARARDLRKNLVNADRALRALKLSIDQLLRLTPKDSELEPELANVQVRIGIVEHLLRDSREELPRSQAALRTLRSAAAKDVASSMVLDLVVTAFLRAEPVFLRDPRFAVIYAERGVTLTHRKTPEWLLSLAQAYRSAGQIQQGRSAAKEGLALLPVLRPGEPKARIRKLLELEARTGVYTSAHN